MTSKQPSFAPCAAVELAHALDAHAGRGGTVVNCGFWDPASPRPAAAQDQGSSFCDPNRRKTPMFLKSEGENFPFCSLPCSVVAANYYSHSRQSVAKATTRRDRTSADDLRPPNPSCTLDHHFVGVTTMVVGHALPVLARLLASLCRCSLGYWLGPVSRGAAGKSSRALCVSRIPMNLLGFVRLLVAPDRGQLDLSLALDQALHDPLSCHAHLVALSIIEPSEKPRYHRLMITTAMQSGQICGNIFGQETQCFHWV